MKYELKVYDLTNITNVDEYNELINNTQAMYFNKLSDVYNYLGFKIPRYGIGYVGMRGNTEYRIMRIA